MGKLVLLLICLVAALMIVTILAYYLFGLAGFLIVIVLFIGLIFVLKKMAGKLLMRAIATPFIAKGAVLKNAKVQVHAVTPALSPVREKSENISAEEWAEINEEEDHEGPRDHFYLDVTITPHPAGGSFKLWEPGGLGLVSEDTKSGDIEGEVNEVGSVEVVEVWQDNSWSPDEGSKYAGPQRLKLHISVQPGTKIFKFRYYFETFGRVRLPA